MRAHLGAAAFSAAVLGRGELLAHRHTPTEPQLPIYSLTKTYLATLTLLAVRAERLTLETPLRHFRDDVPDGRRISILQLLNHTAGLPDYSGLAAYRDAVAAAGSPWSFDRFANETYRCGLSYPPGEGWQYSNPGYALLADILEQVWEQPLATLLHSHITEPLGLAQTRLVDSLADPRIAPATSKQLHPAGERRDVKDHYHPGWVWHRLIVSDAVDSVRFLDALLRQQWLGPALTARMTALVAVPGEHPPWRRPGYGLGLMGEAGGDRGVPYGHNGGGPGYTTSAFYFASSAVSVAIIAAAEDATAVLEAAFALHDLASG